MTRYVIARQERGEFLAGPVVPVLDLPDAEHIHLHRRPDGTWTADPMKRVIDLAPGELPEARWFWVDVPADPEDGAR